MWFFCTSLIGISFDLYYVFDDVRSTVAWSRSGDPNAAVWIPILSIHGVVVAGLCAASVVGLVLLARGDRRTPAFWTTYFACGVLIIPLLRVLLAAAEARTAPIVEVGSLPDDWDSGLWLAIAVQVAWLLYWARSRRVYLTYGSVGVGRFRLPRTFPDDSVPPAV